MKANHLLVVALFLIVAINPVNGASHPSLVISQADVKNMRVAIKENGRFQQAYLSLKAQLDKAFEHKIDVPQPLDAGGGYSHERHKNNYHEMYLAGVIFQLSENAKYAERVKSYLLAYAEMYPRLPIHPKRKPNSKNPGKLFWQSLNESVWLLHVSQAYDLVYNYLSDTERQTIENSLFYPVVDFLSVQSRETFNKVHNHGTWQTAAVGMTGYVLGKKGWVEQALYGLDKSGKGGFIKQLDMLFSPQGYYNEGPYYQRYALMPFVIFAKSIETNEPERKIFQYRDSVLLKAVQATIDLSYNKLFFPINDAIKSKGIETDELVQGVAIAYGHTKNKQLLDIADQQSQIILTGDGLKVARALDADLATPYQFQSRFFGDGASGEQGALVVMRPEISSKYDDSALVFKPTSQGLGHGHFDKLAWLFYHNGNEIISDYGAARFLNIEAKFGGRYLPENETYAKQTVAHNTVVVDEQSHFNGKLKTANANHPEVHFYQQNKFGTISSASINTAYKEVSLTRTMALLSLPHLKTPLVLDFFDTEGKNKHQFDLPLHFQGQLIDSNFKINSFNKSLSPLGNDEGYQHLWLTGKGEPQQGTAQFTWLNENGSFYSQSILVTGKEQLLFTRLGANDPNFNLRNEQAVITRITDSKKYSFISLLEPHGQYNPAQEFTIGATSNLTKFTHQQDGSLRLVTLGFKTGQSYLLAINQNKTDETQSFKHQGKSYKTAGRLTLFSMTKE